MSSESRPKPTIARRARHTFQQYAIIFVYLFVCFGAITLHKTAVLRDVGVSYAPWGFAAIKALVLGKFMLIGHEIRLGERFNNRPLIYPTLYRSFVFLVFLLVLSGVEEAIAGAWHGQTVAASISAVVGARFFEILSSSFIMFLALLPYFAIRQLADTIGKGQLARLFFVDGRLQDGIGPGG